MLKKLGAKEKIKSAGGGGNKAAPFGSAQKFSKVSDLVHLPNLKSLYRLLLRNIPTKTKGSDSLSKSWKSRYSRRSATMFILHKYMFKRQQLYLYMIHMNLYTHTHTHNTHTHTHTHTGVYIDTHIHIFSS